MSFFTKIFNAIFGQSENDNIPSPRYEERDEIFPQGEIPEPIEKAEERKEPERTFVLPPETLSIDDYYASYQLQLQDGSYIDPNGENFIIGESLFQQIPKHRRKKPEKVLPKIYEDLLNQARSTEKKQVNDRIMKGVKFNDILAKCKRWTNNAKDAGEKFEVYNYLQLVQDFLEADAPLAKNATISFEDDESKELRRLLNESQQTLSETQKKIAGKKKKNIMIIKVPYQKDANLEEKIIPMLQILLFRDNDVEAVVEDAKMYKIRIAFVIPSKNQGPTTLVAVLDAKEQKQFKDLRSDETFSIFVTPNIDATNSIMLSIKKVINNADIIAKVFPRPCDRAADIRSYRQQMASEMDSLFRNSLKPFNQKQKEAIYAMTRPSVNTTFVLYGPPGSGKSYTIVEAIRQLFQPTTSFFGFFSTPPNRKILICTPSNMAADAIAEAIVDRNFIDLNEVFRLMSSSRDAFSRNHKLDSITRTTVLLDTNNDAIRPVYDVPSGDAIKKFNIIICTLGSTPKLSRYLPAGHFSHIFVDEAAQASEMEIWLALGHLATAETRLILAGDPKQLGPVTTVPVLNIDCFGYKSSLILRLTKPDVPGMGDRQKNFNENPRYLIQLTDNHRSHHQIVKLSSTLFYKNSLVPTNPPGHNSLCSLPFLPLGDFPVLFHSVKSGVEEASTTKSRRNLAEVDVVVRYVNLCIQHKVEEKDIGVIAPYKFQAEKLRHRLKNHPMVTVETVEKFQGSERRVIIISTVRTSGDLGFMAQDLRINTAITRAKHLLIIVGNEECLKNDDTWSKIINFCATNRSFVDTFPGDPAIQQRFSR